MSRASLWFVPNEEFNAATEDYAIVNESTSWAQRGLQEHNSFLGDDSDLELEYSDGEARKITFKDVINGLIDYGNSFSLGPDTQLLYGDVDGDDKEHRDINTRIAKEGFLEEEPEKSKDARQKLISYLARISYDKNPVKDDDVDYEDFAAKKKEITEQKLARNKGLVSPKIVDYLISLEEGGEREAIDAILSVLSNQHLRKTYRTVILLIGMIDKGPAKEPGSKEGWAIAYDFQTNRITVKPYLFDKTHHPLAEKWDVELPEDGICFSGHPSAFVDKVYQLEADVKGKRHEVDPQHYGFRMLVYYFIAEWIVRHWKVLEHVEKANGEATMTTEGLERVEEAMRAFLEESANIDFPEKRQEPTPRKPINTFVNLQRDLEDWEPTIREEAIKAKGAGDEVAANKAAELYENLWEQLQAFNMSLGM